MTREQIILAIILGIPGGVISIYIYNKLPKIGGFIVRTLIRISKRYSNSIYKSASGLDISRMSSFNSYLLILFFEGILVVGFIYNNNTYHSKTKEIENGIKELLHPNTNTIKTKSLTNSEFYKEIIDIRNKILFYTSAFWIVLALSFIYISLKYFNNIYIVIISNEFLIIMRKLKPYITNEEYDKYFEQWSYLSCRDDFIKIEKELDERLKKVSLAKEILEIEAEKERQNPFS
jgi:hypothetical protein